MRVSVIGTSGSGKTTFAAELARALGARHVDLDALADAWSGPVLRKPFNRGELARELARATAPGEPAAGHSG